MASEIQRHLLQSCSINNVEDLLHLCFRSDLCDLFDDVVCFFFHRIRF